MKYFGEWTTHQQMAEAWASEPYAAPVVLPAGMATEDEVLFASYYAGGYDGDAFVLFERDGQLYEVQGSHCSCFGLEYQWEPEAATWPALAMRDWWSDDLRNPLSEHPAGAREAMRALLAEHGYTARTAT